MKSSKRARIVSVALLCLGPMLAASAQTSQRPIQDWISPNLSAGGIYWYDSRVALPPLAFFDYFGRNNALYSLGLGTQLDGTVTERALASGRAQVHVVLHSTNVLTWAVESNFSTLLFGHLPAQVKSGADAALGDTLLTVDFENSAPGAPLPSLWSLSFTPSSHYSLQKLALVASASGTLRAAFGVPEGTPGKLHTTQRGLYDVRGFQVNGQDVFPAEKVDIHATP